ncbi:unnamed protein product (macronuclear) [Paramecium tetraurelia]|uniref:Enkurin domain-containing protein n=1 Tax=Paramecium tetraurelia TaxID=5888 RepID=A0C7B8_PARTE|nr:uncharacterized protein GSPATT00035815001 [Paramecium tetraurelia]CAK66685.1 unnamed protein product [Paramecium tetraurelia]|eukprot:XP_001434082.1 hypothetical protein (macronuclear) [Paramecium tetraurelia strain d4-2]
MSIGIIRAKCALSNPMSNNVPGAMPILLTLQNHENDKNSNEPKLSESIFIPFVNERDRMNRLFQADKYSTPRKQNIQQVQETANEKWIQNDPMKLKFPPKKLSLEDRNLSKYRSRSNAELRMKVIQATTERQHLLLSQDLSIQPQFEEYKKAVYENILNRKKQIHQSPQSMAKNQSTENLQLFAASALDKFKQSRSPSVILVKKQIQQTTTKHKHLLNFKLPSLIQKEYIKQFLDNNQKIKDLIQEQNEEKFKFPTDFEPKIVEMKKQLKKMKSRLKNWDTDRQVTDNKGFLKEIATGILNK